MERCVPYPGATPTGLPRAPCRPSAHSFLPASAPDCRVFWVFCATWHWPTHSARDCTPMHLTAFRIPGVFRRFVADEGLTGSGRGVARAEQESGTDEARNLAGRVLADFWSWGRSSASGPSWVPPGWSTSLPPAFAPTPRVRSTCHQNHGSVLITVSLVKLGEGLLNHRNHFFVPKLAPAS